MPQRSMVERSSGTSSRRSINSQIAPITTLDGAAVPVDAALTAHLVEALEARRR